MKNIDRNLLKENEEYAIFVKMIVKHRTIVKNAKSGYA